MEEAAEPDNPEDGISNTKQPRESSKEVAVLLNCIKTKKKDAIEEGKAQLARTSLAVKLKVLSTSDQSITCLIDENGSEYYLIVVYASNCGIGRRDLWKHLLDLKSRTDF
ncbi:hypothetical protein PTKIN_Ptkin14bG0212500 [Pterospermum kingtungense]